MNIVFRRAIFVKKMVLLYCYVIGGIYKQSWALFPSGYFSINSLQDQRVLEILHYANQSTLVLFDIDHTLMIQEGICARYLDRLAAGRGSRQVKKSCPRHQHSLYSKGYALLGIKPQRVLVEGHITNRIFNEFKATGATVCALTHTDTSPLDDIEHVPEWRRQQLDALGISFESSIGEELVTTINQSLLTGIASINPHATIFPLFYKNMLCTNRILGQHSKGAVLKIFLQKLLLTQELSFVVSFDDCPEDLLSIQATCQDLGIPVYLFEYQGSKNYLGHGAQDVCDIGWRIWAVLCSAVKICSNSIAALLYEKSS